MIRFVYIYIIYKNNQFQFYIVIPLYPKI